MAKRRRMLKDERLNSKIEQAMHMSKTINIGTRNWRLEPWPFDQRSARKPLLRLIVLLGNQVQYIPLTGVILALIWYWLGNQRLRNVLQMNPESPAGPKPHILQEFDPQTIDF